MVERCKLQLLAESAVLCVLLRMALIRNEQQTLR